MFKTFFISHTSLFEMNRFLITSIIRDTESLINSEFWKMENMSLRSVKYTFKAFTGS